MAATSNVVLLGGKRIHLALLDSRGTGVHEAILGLNHSREYFDLKVRKGETLEGLIREAETYIKDHPFDVVYIAGGANNITYKDSFTKRISYRWGAGDDLKNHLTNIVKVADRDLHSKFPATKIVFCPLVGTDLKRVVNEHPVKEEDQHAVEEAVWEFNSIVFEINKTREVFSPPLQHQVHRFCKGYRRSYYQHLEDGLHPTKELKLKWAQHFIKAMARN